MNSGQDISVVIRKPAPLGVDNPPALTPTFRDGRLSTIDKPWTTWDTERAKDFANALHDLVSQFVTEGMRACMIDTREQVGAGGEIRSVTIHCGQKMIWITMSRLKGDKGAATSILERCCSKE